MECRMVHAFTPWIAQFWRDGKLWQEISDLPIDAARHLAVVHMSMGETVRLWADNGKTNWTEVYSRDYGVRVGPYEQTTLVRFNTSGPADPA